MISHVIVAFITMLLSAEPPHQDVDAFMHEVLSARDSLINEFSSHELVENETLVIRGRLEDAPLRTFTFRWLWKQTEGTLVRFPERINGVHVDESTQQRYRDAFIERREAGRTYSKISGLFFLFENDFSNGRFLYAGKENAGGKELLAIEFIPDPENGEIPPEGPDVEELIQYKLRRARFLIDPESRRILRLQISLNSFRFNDVEELELLPDFISERLDFFDFEDVEFTLNMMTTEDGRTLPESIHATGNKRRIGYNLRVEFSKIFSAYRRIEMGAGK